MVGAGAASSGWAKPTAERDAARAAAYLPPPSWEEQHGYLWLRPQAAVEGWLPLEIFWSDPLILLRWSASQTRSTPCSRGGVEWRPSRMELC